MRRVTVEISDEAYQIVRSAMTARWLAQSGPTAVEGFAARVVEALDAGTEVVTIKTKAERAAEAAEAMAKSNPNG